MITGLLILISAPSGAGKTSLVEAALQQDANLVVSVSHTTREKRPQEQEGVNYFFVSPESFQAMVDAGDFLEHAVVFGNHYGTSAKAVQDLRATGRDVILEIDWQGADQVREVVADALSIFILPPSEAVLQERLNRRGQDSAETIARRLSEAQLDMQQASRYQYIIVNDDFQQATKDLLAICHAHRLTAEQQMRASPAVQSILSAG